MKVFLEKVKEILSKESEVFSTGMTGVGRPSYRLQAFDALEREKRGRVKQ